MTGVVIHLSAWHSFGLGDDRCRYGDDYADHAESCGNDRARCPAALGNGAALVNRHMHRHINQDADYSTTVSKKAGTAQKPNISSRAIHLPTSRDSIL